MDLERTILQRAVAVAVGAFLFRFGEPERSQYQPAPIESAADVDDRPLTDVLDPGTTLASKSALARPLEEANVQGRTDGCVDIHCGGLYVSVFCRRSHLSDLLRNVDIARGTVSEAYRPMAALGS